MLRENNVKREELKARALALKLLGKIFQVQLIHAISLVQWFLDLYILEFDITLWFQEEKLARNGGTSRKKNTAYIEEDDDTSSDSSGEEDSHRQLSYRTPFLTQAR